MFAKAALLTALLPGALGLGILFPAYFCGDKANCYATDCPQYDSIVAQVTAHPTVPIYTIINPASGPMSTADLYPNYATCIPELKNAGSSSTVLGYVRTNYGDQPIAQVEADIDTYASWPAAYRPTGIFFDEGSNDAAHVSQYTSYATYARSKGFSFIVYNPGTAANSGYFGSSAADLVVTYESAYSSFSTSALTISSSTPAAKQAVLMYNGPSTAPASIINQLGSLGVGAVFITDDTYSNPNTDNPWDTVPTIWAAEVADVAAA
ncbi:hypothetical protein PENSPDRAFT_652996 [Peniophora sp. CONT]|nr:hypothetical protein PENSPDRAFT_652996 [Peniophora sp. CONT]